MSTDNNQQRNPGLPQIHPPMWEGFYQDFQMPIFIEDVSNVLAALEEIRQQGVTDLAEWLDARPEFITQTVALIEVIDVNNYAVEWSGARDKKELISSLGRMVLPENLPAFKTILVDLYAGRRHHFSESQYLSFDNRRLFTLNQALLPTPGDDRAILVMACSDITELKETHLELVNSQERYSRLVEAAQDVILCHDLGGEISFINQAGLDLTGFTQESILGQDLSLLLPDRIDGSQRRRNFAILGESRGRTLFEATMVSHDGKGIPVEVHSTILPGPGSSGNQPMVLALIRDISERKKAEEKHRDLEVCLKNTQKMESLGALAKGLAHDFNNLLVTIMGNTELLQGGKNSPADIQEGLGVIMEASTQAADLCRQLQTFVGQTGAEVASQDLNAILENMSRLLKVTVTGKAKLDINLQPGQLEVAVDAGQIRQVIMSLVTNASHSLSEDGGQIVVRTGRRSFMDSDLKLGQYASHLDPGDFIFCEVKDSGSGMDLETVQRLFDPFFTTKSGSRGLGMSSSLGIIQSHKGGFLVNSIPGSGTEITFLLPVDPSTLAGNFQPTKSKKEPDGLHLILTGKTILSVDEDSAVRSVGEGFLRRLGCHVLSADNGPSAVQIFGDRHQDIDAVLLDLTMTGMDGVETCRRLRVLRPDLPVVFCSGFTADEVRQRAAEVGQFGFVPKPFRLAQIRAIMAEVLDPEREPRG